MSRLWTKTVTTPAFRPEIYSRESSSPIPPRRVHWILVGENFMGTSGNPDNALVTASGTDTFDIIFTGGNVFAAGIGPGCFLDGGGLCEATLTIRVFGAGDVLLGSTVVDASSHFDDFLGIESNEFITRINVSGPADVLQGIDGIAFVERVASNVPTLSEWGMISAAAGLGLIGVFFALRRRMAKA